MNKKYWTWGAVGVVALLLTWLFLRRPKTQVELVEDVAAAPNMQFYEPYYFTTPGIADLPGVLNGSDSPFNSQIDIYLSNPALGALANKYIPMFGFVGVTAVGAQ